MGVLVILTSLCWYYQHPHVSTPDTPMLVTVSFKDKA